MPTFASTRARPYFHKSQGYYHGRLAAIEGFTID